jgi:hypothetical protein
MDYELTFLPKNPIPDNAMIVLDFPAAFNFDIATVTQHPT